LNFYFCGTQEKSFHNQVKLFLNYFKSIFIKYVRRCNVASYRGLLYARTVYRPYPANANNNVSVKYTVAVVVVVIVVVGVVLIKITFHSVARRTKFKKINTISFEK